MMMSMTFSHDHMGNYGEHALRRIVRRALKAAVLIVGIFPSSSRLLEEASMK